MQPPALSSAALATAGPLTIGQKTGANSALKDKARQLEGVFLNTLVSEMFKTVGSQGEIGNSYAEKTWRSMESEQLASSIANSGGVGLADDIMRSLLHTQQAATAAPAPTTGVKTQ